MTGEWYYFNYREKWSSRGGMVGHNDLTQEIVGILAIRNKRKLFEFTYGLCMIPTRDGLGQLGTFLPFFGFNFDMRQLRWWEGED